MKAEGRLTNLNVSKDGKAESQDVGQNQKRAPVIVNDGSWEIAEINAQSEQNVGEDPAVKTIEVVLEYVT